ncbi:MAG: LysR family transcriptional regulator [Burkholderiales bacterium]|nr:LysR family transcriptional regulator [Burkholderiales bacterium]
MELRHLRYFIAVAEELHFGRAAQRLGMSQPPLSQQIKALEQDIGTRLFERTRHKVSLTQAGESMLAEAHQLLEHAERVRSVARQSQGAPLSRLNIGCLSSVLFDILPPLLDRLHATHPEIRIALQDFETASALAALLDEKVDVAIIRIDKAEPPLRARRIMNDHFIAAIPARHALARRATVALRDLADEPLVVYSRRMWPSSHDRILDACTRAGFRPNLAYRGATITSQIGFVACALGIALVPNTVRHWRVPRVVYRPLDEPIPASAVSLVWHGRRRSEAIRLFLDTAQEVYPEVQRV